MSRTGATPLPVRLGGTPDDYARIGIEPRAIKPWEDAMRTDGSRGTYEWWYLDAHLDDGAKLEVRIGDNVFVGDLHTYTIGARVQEVQVDITLTGQVPAWRPETGHWLFGAEGEHYFAWLASVPQGRVEATYRVGGTSRTATGVGYHDHNWGNAPMLELMHHWYWARGRPLFDTGQDRASVTDDSYFPGGFTGTCMTGWPGSTCRRTIRPQPSGCCKR